MGKHVSARENTLATQQQQLREQYDLIVKTLYPPLGSDVIRVFEEPGTLLSPYSTTIKDKGFISPIGIWSLLPLTIALSIYPELSLSYINNVALAVEFFVAAFDLLQTAEENKPTLFLQERGVSVLFNIVTALLALSQRTLLSVAPHVQQEQTLLSLLQAFQKGSDVVTPYFDQPSNQAKPMIDTNTHYPYETFLSLTCYIGALSANPSPELNMDFAQLGTLLGRILTTEHSTQKTDHDNRTKTHKLLTSIEERVSFAPSLHLLLHDMLQSEL